MTVKRSNSSHQVSILLGGCRIPYSVRRNSRARRIWIKVEEESGLVLVLPRWGRASSAQAILRKHKSWILERLRKREELLAQAMPALGTAPTVIYRGRPFPLRIRSSACAQPTAEWHRDRVILNVPRALDPPLGEVLEGLFRDRAKLVFEKRVQALSDLLGVRPKRVQVRDQKTRWGSCTGRGTLAFNWRLLLAPPAVLDYVVVHELCHLRHPHHGQGFWKMVQTFLPNFEAQRIWLRDNGCLLRGA
jgi:predicted metal-dependent hydrolase